MSPQPKNSRPALAAPSPLSVFCLLPFALCLLTCSASAAAFRSELGLGADYSNQRYTTYLSDTTEDDTNDIETEGRAFWRGDFESGAEENRLNGSANLAASTRSVRGALYAQVERSLAAPVAVEAAGDVEGRWYHNFLPALADTFARQSYVTGSARLGLEYKPWEWLELALRERPELHHYAKPDSFSYDYFTNRIEAGVNVPFGLLNSFDAGWTWSRRFVWLQDSQDYSDHAFRLGLDAWLGDDWRLHIGTDASRRRYAAPERSYRDVDPSLQVGLDIGTAFTVSVEDDARLTFHDSTTAVYTNAFENRLKPGLEWRPTTDLGFRLGPQWERYRTLPAVRAEDYRDRSLLLGFDLMKPGRLWLSFEDQLGLRTYEQPDSGYQTNYRYNEFTGMLNWTIIAPRALVLNGMVTVAPEWHADRTDNLSATTYSLELSYGL